jgi:hypothetical protein
MLWMLMVTATALALLSMYAAEQQCRQGIAHRMMTAVPMIL